MIYPFVTEFRDRHGKLRARFRRAGFSAYLPTIDSEDFEAEYNRLMAVAPPTPIRSPKSAVGQLRTLMRRHQWSGKGEFVYFVATRGMVKIGFSSAVITRLAQLTAQNPTRLRFLAAAPGSKDVERRLHEAFAADRIKGEWFRPSLRLKAAISAVKNGGTFANIV
jgi:hypothetical protein